MDFGGARGRVFVQFRKVVEITGAAAACGAGARHASTYNGVV
jgi:hypothetical protein